MWRDVGGSAIEIDKIAGNASTVVTEEYTEVQLNRQAEFASGILRHLARDGRRLTRKAGGGKVAEATKEAAANSAVQRLAPNLRQRPLQPTAVERIFLVFPFGAIQHLFEKLPLPDEGRQLLSLNLPFVLHSS